MLVAIRNTQANPKQDNVINLKTNIKDESNLIEYIRECLFDRSEGVHSTEIVRDVFLLNDIEPEPAQQLVRQLLAEEADFYCDSDGYWHVQKTPQFHVPLPQQTFVVVDLETTGGGTRDHRILEVGAVKIERGKITDQFSTLINPQRSIPDYVTKITGINEGMITDAPLPEDIMPKLVDFIGDGVIIAHNLPYDLGFINTTLTRLGYQSLRNPTLCTLELSRFLLPHLKNHKLEDVAWNFGISIEARHRALDDAMATAQMLLHFLQMLANARIDRLEQIYALLPRKNRVDISELMINKRDVQDLPDSKGVFMFIDAHGEIIYIEGVVNIRQRVREFLYSKKRQTAFMQNIIRTVADIQALPTGSYTRAKFKAGDLIREYHPRFNLLRKPHVPMLHVVQTNGSTEISVAKDFVPGEGQYFGPLLRSEQLQAIEMMKNETGSLAFLNPLLFRENNRKSGISHLNRNETTTKLTELFDIPALFGITGMTLYVAPDYSRTSLELYFVQNYRTVGVESIRFNPDSIDLLREEVLLTIKPYFTPRIEVLPRVDSQIDLLRIEMVRQLESDPLSRRSRIHIDLKKSRPYHVVRDILKIGQRVFGSNNL